MALRAISEGDAWFAPKLLTEFSDDSRPFRPGDAPDQRRQETLTPREETIVGLIKRRLGNREIAEALKISESTVKFHLSNIFRKLGVRDRHSAAEVKVAIRKGRSLPFFRNRHALFPSRVWPLFVR